jgi:hypothetical protein
MFSTSHTLRWARTGGQLLHRGAKESLRSRTAYVPSHGGRYYQGFLRGPELAVRLRQAKVRCSPRHTTFSLNRTQRKSILQIRPRDRGDISVAVVRVAPGVQRREAVHGGVRPRPTAHYHCAGDHKECRASETKSGKMESEECGGARGVRQGQRGVRAPDVRGHTAQRHRAGQH